MATEFVVVTRPATALLTPADVKSMLLIDHTADDALLTTMIAEATDEAQKISGRSFITRTCRMTLDRWPPDNKIKLLYPPALSIISVAYTDADGVEHTVDAADYDLDTDSTPGIVVPAVHKAWPTASLRAYSPIRVTYTAGYGAAAASVDPDIVGLVRGLVVVDYESRESISNQALAQRNRILDALQARWGWGE